MRLTPATVSGKYPSISNEDIKNIKFSDSGLTELDDLSCYPQLQGVELNKNELKDLEGISFNRDVVWLSAKENKITKYTYVRKMTKLKVLNLGTNEITSMERCALPNLQALILNDNQIKKIENLDALPLLNSLVLSRNRLEDINAVVKGTNLKKLSLSNNKIRRFPDISALSCLTELRLNHNLLTTVPECIVNLGQLTLLDLGHNRIKDYGALEPLRTPLKLRQLTLRGNPIADLDDYQQQVLAIATRVQVLDTRKLDVRDTATRKPGQMKKGGKGLKREREPDTVVRSDSDSGDRRKRPDKREKTSGKGKGKGRDVPREPHNTDTDTGERNAKRPKSGPNNNINNKRDKGMGHGGAKQRTGPEVGNPAPSENEHKYDKGDKGGDKNAKKKEKKEKKERKQKKEKKEKKKDEKHRKLEPPKNPKQSGVVRIKKDNKLATAEGKLVAMPTGKGARKGNEKKEVVKPFDASALASKYQGIGEGQGDGWE